jgi:hypothetical protein
VPAGIAELSEVRHIIEPFLAAMNEQNALQRVTASLRAKADIRRISTREAEGIGLEALSAVRLSQTPCRGELRSATRGLTSRTG